MKSCNLHIAVESSRYLFQADSQKYAVNIELYPLFRHKYKNLVNYCIKSFEILELPKVV